MYIYIHVGKYIYIHFPSRLVCKKELDMSVPCYVRAGSFSYLVEYINICIGMYLYRYSHLPIFRYIDLCACMYVCM